jgi:hypothetical protein
MEFIRLCFATSDSDDARTLWLGATRFARSDHEIGATSQRRVEEARSTRAAGEGVVVFYGIAKPVHVPNDRTSAAGLNKILGNLLEFFRISGNSQNGLRFC